MYEGSCNGWLVVGLVASGGNGCGNSNSGVNIGIFFSVFFVNLCILLLNYSKKYEDKLDITTWTVQPLKSIKS